MSLSFIAIAIAIAIEVVFLMDILTQETWILQGK